MPKLLFVENRDSFSGIIADYLVQLGQEVVWVDHAQPPGNITEDAFSGIVLSPGPGRPEESGNLMAFIDQFYGRTPILGICLGHQALALKAGGRVGAATQVAHGKISRVSLKAGHPMWQGLGQEAEVVRYHSLAVLDCGQDFQPTAWAACGQVMAMAHGSLPVWGIQWHPEALLSAFGLRMLANWLTFAHIPCQPLVLGRSPEKPPMQAGPMLPF